MYFLDKYMLTPSLDGIFEECDESIRGSGNRRAKGMCSSYIKCIEDGLKEQMYKGGAGYQSEKYQEGCASRENMVEKM